ncbi:MAG TPA: oligosaccharide flippase family protein [Candidatus Saccharimonadales bacterium]
MRLRGIITALHKSDFMRHNAVFFLGSLAVSVLNYLYYPVLSRMLNLEEYGEAQILISLFLQLTIFLTVLSQVSINIVANSKSDKQQISLLLELEKFAFIISIAVLIIGSMLSPVFKDVLNFTDALPFIVLLIALVCTVPLTFRSAYLRGHKAFTSVSVANIVGSAGKILVSALLVAIGLSTPGAIGGIIAAQLLAFMYAAHKAKAIGFVRPSMRSYFKPPNLTMLLPELKYGGLVLIASLGVLLLSSIDMLFVKYYFDAETAGGYAGVATVAKILFFLTASVAQVMLSSVKLASPQKQNRQLLIKSGVLVAGLGGITLLLFVLFPKFFVTTLMGDHFADYAYLLPTLSIALFVISILNLIVLYFMALRRYIVGALVTAGVGLTFSLLLSMHSSLTDIVNGLLLGSVGMLTLIIAWQIIDKTIRSRYA